MKGPLGVAWDLFLGDSKDLHESVTKLKGKMVVVTGTLEVFGDKGAFSGPRPPTRLVVRVTSLQAAVEK
jgi:hypothetical protein